MQNKSTVLTSAFEQEVYDGLTARQKHLSSKYFYDEIGDKLFQDIMAMPEYYLTDSEYEVLDANKEELAEIFKGNNEPFSLFELGAGDGKKTKILLKHFTEKEVDFDYRPIDISQNALDQLETAVNKELPRVAINTLQGTYFDTLANIGETTDKRKVILFLGSNIGNLLHPQAISFLRSMKEILNDDDLVFMGFDQKKNPQTILDAYNDKTGITEAFNKNILARINKEMGGDFDLEKFLHWEVYDPETGTAKSYLVSKEEQTITIEGLDLKVNFKPWETIHTEISQKYDDEVVAWLAQEAGLQITHQFSDADTFYKNYIFKKN